MNQDRTHASDEANATAVLDVRRLVDRCFQMEGQIQQCAQRIEEQSDIIEQLGRENQSLRGLAEFGQKEMLRQKNDILTRLRAIVLYSGDSERLRSFEEKLQDDRLTPQEVLRIRQSVTDEFLSLYPTRPLSQFQKESGSAPARPEFSAYRLRTESPHQIQNPNGGNHDTKY